MTHAKLCICLCMTFPYFHCSTIDRNGFKDFQGFLWRTECILQCLLKNFIIQWSSSSSDKLEMEFLLKKQKKSVLSQVIHLCFLCRIYFFLYEVTPPRPFQSSLWYTAYMYLLTKAYLPIIEMGIRCVCLQSCQF